MDKTDLARYEAQAHIMKALSHPTRLFIVHQLAKTETCVCELAEMVGADISTISKHLLIMKHAGIVSSEKTRHQYLLLAEDEMRAQFLCLRE